MDLTIKPFDTAYLEDQVSLGNEVMANWKFQRQSTLEHLKQVYARDDFQPGHRLYAFDGDQLVGFQTCHILEEEEDGQRIARMEFPICRDNNIEVIKKLQNQMEQILRQNGADFARVRVSDHWGITSSIAEQFGYHYEKPHLITSVGSIEELKEPNQFEYQFKPVGDTTLDDFRDIFPKRFPMRYEEEIDQWISYYKEQDPVIWGMIYDGEPVGHIIGFNRDRRLALTAAFSLGDRTGTKLQHLVSNAIKLAKKIELGSVSLSVGDDQVKDVSYLESLGFTLNTEVSYFTKSLNQ